MVNSAKQSRLACARIRIASSLSLLATTRTPNFTLPPGRGRPGGASRTGGRGDQSSKPMRLPGRSPAIAMAKVGRKRVAGTIMPGGDCCDVRPAFTAVQERKSLLARPSNKCPASPILYGVGTLYGMGTATNPKRALLVFIRLYANSSFVYATFSTGSERTSYYLLHCGWG